MKLAGTSRVTEKSVNDSQMSRISGQIDRNTSSASAGETKSVASQRSVSQPKRLAAAGASRVGAGAGRGRW